MSVPTLPPSHLHLLESPLVAALATVRPDGAPQCNPVWFKWNGRAIVLTQETVSVKLRNMRADPRVSLTVIDPVNPFHYLEVRGVVSSVEPDAGAEFVSALARDYVGAVPPALVERDRVVVTVEPVAFAMEQGRVTT